MLECLKNFIWTWIFTSCSIRVYLTALLEYIPDCSIRVYRSFKQVLKRAHVTSVNVNPSLRDECKFYQLLCCAITGHYIAHSFCPATLNGLLGSCCRSLNFTGGFQNPPSLRPWLSCYSMLYASSSSFSHTIGMFN